MPRLFNTTTPYYSDLPILLLIYLADLFAQLTLLIPSDSVTHHTVPSNFNQSHLHPHPIYLPTLSSHLSIATCEYSYFN